ncbi:hypothetical protein D3C86_242820 [compost metagenome]
MQRLKRLVPLAAVLTLVATPAAIAPALAQGTQHQQMQHMMGATSANAMISHAYQEALNAHEAAALGMNDMATNHLENVRIAMAMIEPQRTGMNQGLQQQLAAIRQSVESVNLPEDPVQAAQNTQRVVSQFVAFYNRAPEAMGGGGGAAKAGMMPTAFDLTSQATMQIAGVQTSVVSRDWAGAQQQAKNALANLDSAIKMSEAGPHKLDAAVVRELKVIRTDANTLLTQTRNKNQQANQSAGKLVGRLGTVSPRIAMSLTQGGGAGQTMPQKQHR